MENKISRTLLDESFTYETYRKFVDYLLAKGKSTGTEQTPERYEYTKLNVQRMNRLDKSIVLNDELKAELAKLNRKLIWLVIVEAWCGDVSQILPALAKISEESDMIEFRCILRDENPGIMNQYLTNGAKSIPVLVCYDAETLTEIWKWGPRPDEAQKMMMDMNAGGVAKEDRIIKIQLWYAENKSKSLQNEILNLLKT